MKTLLNAIKDADDVEIDACWAILRDFRLGIMRKLKCWSLIFDLDENKVLSTFHHSEKPIDSLTQMILERELKKVVFRAYFSK